MKKRGGDSMAEITLESILSAPNDQPLDFYEERFLEENGYVIDGSTPDRIKNCIPLVVKLYAYYDGRVDISKYDIKSEAFKSNLDLDIYTYNFYGKLMTNGYDISGMPHLKEFQTVNKFDAGVVLFHSYCTFVLYTNKGVYEKLDIRDLPPEIEEMYIEFIVKNNVPAIAIPDCIIEHRPDLIRTLPDGELVLSLQNSPNKDEIIRTLGRLHKMSFDKAITEENFNKCSDEEKDILLRYSVDYSSSLLDYPPYLIQDKKLVEMYKSKHEPEMPDAVVDALCMGKYDEQKAKDFFESIGVSSIDELVEKTANDPNFKISDAARLASYNVFALKKLHEYGIDDVKIALNQYDFFRSYAGCYLHETKTLTMYDTIINVGGVDPYYTIAHECNHAKQYVDREKMDFDAEPDVDLFTKDYFLREVMGNEYYQLNYPNESHEFDADYKASREIYDMISPKKDLYEIMKAKIAKKAYDEKLIIDKVQYRIAYAFSRTRKNLDGTVMHLDDLVEIELNKKLKTSPSFKEFEKEVQEKYPLLALEYELGPRGVRKKTPKELVHDMNRSKSDEEYNVYRGIIKSSMDIRKSKNFEGNMRAYERMSGSPFVPYDIRCDLRKDMTASRELNQSRGHVVEGPDVGVGRKVGV